MPRGIVFMYESFARRSIEQRYGSRVRLRRVLLIGSTSHAFQRRAEGGPLGPVGNGTTTRLAHRFLR